MATDNKYDRQLRLWGARGQKALSESSILLVNADGVGTETLKNLVLPGVGKVTVMDDRDVSLQDLGTNFFVSADRVGESRATVVRDLLCELNPDVKGEAVTSSVVRVLQQNDEEVALFFRSFNLVIAANLPEEQLLPLANRCATLRLPLIAVRAYGFIGTCRLQYARHEVVESKPDASKPDLRICEPFPELVSFCDSFNLSSMDSQFHGHVPFVVILYKALAKWRADHNGTNPANFNEKQEFKEKYVRDLARNVSEEMNFQEALSQSYLAYSSGRELPYEVEELLEAAATWSGLTTENTSFEVLVYTLHLFRQQRGGDLPLAGDVPDMTAHSETYVALQKCYASKAAADVEAFTSTLNELQSKFQLNSSVAALTNEDIVTFCKNVRNLRCLTTRTLEEERAHPAKDEVMEALYDPYPGAPAQTPVLWYLALQAADAFRAQRGAFPGEADKDTLALDGETDILWARLTELACTYIPGPAPGQLADTLKSVLSRAHAEETTRAGGVEMHNIAALMGGIASQEAVKLITHQYVPLNNTYVYNGIACVGSSHAF